MLKGFRAVYLAAVLSLAVAAIDRTATFLVLRSFVDSALAKGLYTDRLYLFALAFVAFACIEGGASFLKGKLSARSAERVTLHLRNYLFDYIQRLSLSLTCWP